MIRTKWLPPGSDLTHAFEVRRAVFIDEQGVPEHIELDENDAYAVHLVVYENNSVIATGRMLIEDPGVTIGRVAVRKEQRGQGIGDLVMRMLIRKAFEAGFDKQYIHAQESARGFYEKLGFAPIGEPFEEAGIAHIGMWRTGDIGCCCS